MSTQAAGPFHQLGDGFNRRAFEVAVGAMLLAAAGLHLAGVWQLPIALPWLFLSYGILVVVVEVLFSKLGESIDPILWACVTGYLAAMSIICTRLAMGVAPTAPVWAASLATFTVLSATLAISMNGRTLQVHTAAVSIVIVVAGCVALTILAPIIHTNPDWWNFAIAVFVATSITLLLLFLNERIFEKRQTITQHLLDNLATYRPGVKQADYSLLKMAALKYAAHLSSGGPPTPPTPPGAAPPAASPAASRWPLALAASAYLIFSVLGYMLLLTPICVVFGTFVGPGTGGTCSSSWVSSALLWTAADKVEFKDLLTTVSMAGAAFLGAHLFTLRFLFKAALNSELNQFKWIRGALHMLTGVIVGLIMYRALKDVNVYAGALWLGVAFASGWIPDFALSTVFRHAQVSRLKSIDEDILKAISAVPVEIIDGIDYDTRYRLEENNIVDVQSLATYNPICLYVETPYGLAQIYDWILQAQLCLAVGPKGFIELKKIAIRTIFQLEDEVANAPAGYARMIGNAMFAAAPPERLKAIIAAAAPTTPPPPTPATPDIDPAVVQYAVAKACDDPYIVGLRRLWEYIYK